MIKSRNRANAIGVTGLFTAWLLEVFYIVFGGFLLLIVDDSNLIREVVTSLKLYDYYIIPLIHVHTSPPIKRFMENSDNKLFMHDFVGVINNILKRTK